MGYLVGDAQRAPLTQGAMTLTWSPEAIDDLASLRAYISADDPATAKRVALHIIHSVEELLPKNPQLGHPGPGARHARTRYPENPVRCSLPSAQRGAANLARLSPRPPLAETLLGSKEK